MKRLIFSNHLSIKAILMNNGLKQHKDRISFRFPNRIQIEELLSNITMQKACGHDMLPPPLPKEPLWIPAVLFPKILNTSAIIVKGCYPSHGKMGQVTPRFKKDDKTDRPETVLPCLNNILERLQPVPRILSGIINGLYLSIQTAPQLWDIVSLLRLMKDWKASQDRKELLTLRGVIKRIWYNNTFAVNCQTISIWSKWQTACPLFDDYLFRRLQRVKVGDAYLSWQAFRRCVSQGSVLGPILFFQHPF